MTFEEYTQLDARTRMEVRIAHLAAAIAGQNPVAAPDAKAHRTSQESQFAEDQSDFGTRPNGKD